MIKLSDMRVLEVSYSNCDFVEPLELTDELMADAKACGTHPAHNHFGYMYYQDGQFHEDVWVYGFYKQTVSGSTLREVFNAVNEIYGED